MNSSAGRCALLGVIVACLTACGASAPQSAPPAPPPRATVAAPAPVAAPLPELTPVGVPADVVAVGRWRAPSQTLNTVVGWSGLPLDWRKMLSSAAPGAERLLKLDAPAEAVVMLDRSRGAEPDFAPAVSVGLSSLDEALAFAREQGWSVTAVAPGAYRVSTPGGGDCIAARALGPAPARLVCGESARQVERLYPYATRGLPTEILPDAELRLELRVAPLREFARQVKVVELHLLQELARDDPAYDRGLGEIVRALGSEVSSLAEDTDQIALSLNFVPDAGIDATLSARLRATTAFVSQTVADMGRRAALPPDLFWNLPADSSSAWYSVAPDLGRLTPVRRRLAQLVDGYLEEVKLPATSKQRVDAALLADEWSNLGTRWVGARGTAPSFAPPRGGDAAPATSERWMVVGFEELPTEKLVALTQKVLSAYEDPEARKRLDSRGKGQPSEWPRVSKRAAGGLGRGGAHYVLEVPSGKAPPKGAPAQSGGTVHLLIAPSGRSTWVGISADLELIRTKLKSVADGGPSTLRRRPGLDALRQSPSMLGGFVTLSELSSGPGGRNARLFHEAPNRGESPILHRAYTDQDHALEWRWTMPRAAMADLATILPNVAQRMFSR